MDLNSLPEELTLRPSRAKWIGVSVIGLLFTAGGVWMIVEEDGAMPWFCTIFFGLVAIVGLAQLFGRSYLRLYADGFEQNMLGIKSVFHWAEVYDFGVWSTGGNRLVRFQRLQDQGKAIAKINQAMSGGTATLGDNFGMSAEALAVLMEAFRERAAFRAEQHEHSKPG